MNPFGSGRRWFEGRVHLSKGRSMEAKGGLGGPRPGGSWRVRTDRRGFGKIIQGSKPGRVFSKQEGGFLGGQEGLLSPPYPRRGARRGVLGSFLGMGGSSWVLGGFGRRVYPSGVKLLFEGTGPSGSRSFPPLRFCVPSHQSSPVVFFEGKFYRILWPVWPGRRLRHPSPQKPPPAGTIARFRLDSAPSKSSFTAKGYTLRAKPC
jgi:hypothetical protein